MKTLSLKKHLLINYTWWKEQGYVYQIAMIILFSLLLLCGICGYSLFFFHLFNFPEDYIYNLFFEGLKLTSTITAIYYFVFLFPYERSPERKKQREILARRILEE